MNSSMNQIVSAFPRRAGAPAAEPITLAQALHHLREIADGAENDAYVLGLIQAAREACEERTERTLLSTAWRLTLDGFPASGAIELRQPPIIGVTSVQFKDVDGVLQTLAPTDYVVDTASQPGYIVPGPGLAWPETQSEAINTVVVNYTAGYGAAAADVPAPLKHWMLLAIGDMYEMRNASGDKPAVKHDFVDYLLNPYRLLGI